MDKSTLLGEVGLGRRFDMSGTFPTLEIFVGVQGVRVEGCFVNRCGGWQERRLQCERGRARTGSVTGGACRGALESLTDRSSAIAVQMLMPRGLVPGVPLAARDYERVMRGSFQRVRCG